MLKDLIRQLTTIKKKFGDIPVAYVYGDHREMTLVTITESKLVYTNLPIREHIMAIDDSMIKQGSFVNQAVYDQMDNKTDFKPIVLITEKLT